MGSTKSNGRERRALRGCSLLAGALAAALSLAACSGGGNTSASGTATTTAASGQSAAGSSGGPVNIYVVGGEASDPFWSVVKRGADDAAKVVQASGGSVHWLGPQNYNNLGPDAAKLLQTALSAGASAVVGPDWVPAAEDSAFKQITGAGIPLIVYNSGGLSEANTVGALNYVGSDDSLAGKTAGQYMVQHSVKDVLCVNTLPGAANSEARCAGIKQGEATGGGSVTELPLPSSSFGNPTAVTQAIKAALLQNSNLDGVVTIGTTDADSAASALSQAGLSTKVQLATFDVDTTQLNRIKAGTQLLAIDQQPYLQGYLSVSMAFQYVKYGLKLPQQPVLTGPALITKDNVTQAIAGAAAGVR